MKERPILFSAPMILALLDGRKTQTRRIVKPQPISPFHSSSGAWVDMDDVAHQILLMRCRYGVPGDGLWVRETHTFCPKSLSAKKWSHTPEEARVIYATEDLWLSGPYGPHRPKMRPSIHMPRWASRIDLLVKAVRVERLWEISEADARAEGIDLGGFRSQTEGIAGYEHRIEFRGLWESINGPGSWEANPYVWVVEFERVKP